MEHHQLQQLLNEVNFTLHTDKLLAEEKRKNGEYFNVFSILGLKQKENYHSAFIAELLNPKGSHGMGDAFLKEFLQTINCKLPAFDTAKATVQTEAFLGSINEDKTEGGRADIHLYSTNGSAIVIENKIYAADQECQLERYNYHLRQSFNRDNSLLLYLTLNGKQASEHSVHYNIDYTPISYKQHIYQWLERCTALAFDKPFVREIIVQYQNIIKELCNMENPNRHLTEIALQDNNMEATMALLNNYDTINQAITQIRWNFIDMLKQELGEYFKLDGEVELKNLSKPEGGIMLRAKYCSSEWALSVRYENHRDGMIYTITQDNTGDVKYKEGLDYLWKDKTQSQHYPFGANFFEGDLRHWKEAEALKDMRKLKASQLFLTIKAIADEVVANHLIEKAEQLMPTR